jgi:hypothetical protein
MLFWKKNRFFGCSKNLNLFFSKIFFAKVRNKAEVVNYNFLEAFGKLRKRFEKFSTSVKSDQNWLIYLNLVIFAQMLGKQMLSFILKTFLPLVLP